MSLTLTRAEDNAQVILQGLTTTQLSPEAPGDRLHSELEERARLSGCTLTEFNQVLVTLISQSSQIKPRRKHYLTHWLTQPTPTP